jgi:2-(1,2-epoxy-1,2-dihydrophenyl)acetyl-CoA isomerase
MLRGWEMTPDEALGYEAHLQEVAGRSVDNREGIAAFLEKREARFTGR